MLSFQKRPKRVSLSYRQTKILPMSVCLPKELTFNANLKLNWNKQLVATDICLFSFKAAVATMS